MKLNMGLRLNGDVFRIPMKDTALLYEYWCYIKLNRLIYDRKNADGTRKYPVKEGSLFQFDDHGITVDLKKGKGGSRIRYVDLRNGEEVTLFYNPSYRERNGTVIAQKPDNVVMITKTEQKEAKLDQGDQFSYVFDAKYRIDGTDPNSYYAETYGGPGPVEDTINTMHRYRDAIMREPKRATGAGTADGSGSSEAGTTEASREQDFRYVREMFGAYVLFPYGDEKHEYQKHPFYRSIDEVNIGGLPFLPGNTAMVEDLLDRLIQESPESSFERAALPAGVADRLQKVDLTKRNVLVGLCTSKAQYQFCMSHRIYYWPAKDIGDDRFPLEYVAIHQTKGVFGDGNDGIRQYGVIRYYQKMTGRELQKRYTERVPLLPRQRKETFYVFDLSGGWQSLDRTIVSDDVVRHHFYTNFELLKCSSTRKELSMTSLEQLRLYTELQRLIGPVQIDESKPADRVEDETRNVVGFEYNGHFISKFGEYVYVYQPHREHKSYLLAYATKCRKKFFDDVLRDIGE